MPDQDLIYKIAITTIPGIGDVLAKNLVSYCGGVEKVFKAKKQDLVKVRALMKFVAKSIYQFKDFKAAEEEASFIEKNKIKALFYLDEEYPARLKGLTDSPILLYAKGNMDLNAGRIISIVGTRHASEYGRQVTEALVEDLCEYKIIIVSGLAYGIDIIAHRARCSLTFPL
jgi:DNA processing protein